MRQDRLRFITQAFEHVTNIHEAEERKKSKFVQTVSSYFLHVKCSISGKIIQEGSLTGNGLNVSFIG